MTSGSRRPDGTTLIRAVDGENGEFPSAEQRWAALSLVAHHLAGLTSGAPDRRSALSETMIAPASQHLVSPALGFCLSGDAADDPLRDYFVATLTLNRARNAAISAGLDLLLAAFADSGIVPIAMKGAAALLHGIYPDAGVRFVGDLDLLVHEAQLDQALAAAGEAGFVRAPQQRLIPWHHHLPVMVHPILGTGVELHRRPLATTEIVTSAQLFRNAVPHSVGGLPVLLPAATDMIAHLVAHSQVIDCNHLRETVPLRYLLELSLIIDRFGDTIDWADLTERFALARQTEALVMACAAGDYFFGPRTPYADNAPEAAMWLRRGLGRSILWRWAAELRHRLQSVPTLARFEPLRLFRGFRPATLRNLVRPIPERW